MVRKARDHYRRARLRKGSPWDIDTLPAPEPEPTDDDAPWSQVTEPQLQHAVRQLSPRLRQVFDLHEVHRLPYHDVAARLGIPMSTVGTRLRRAREKLRGLLTVELERAGSLP
jgi:RNA polymerase sigma-70 factor (ECF subfamily)